MNKNISRGGGGDERKHRQKMKENVSAGKEWKNVCAGEKLRKCKEIMWRKKTYQKGNNERKCISSGKMKANVSAGE